MAKRPQSRQRKFSFPTPRLEDILVIEERDLSVEKEIAHDEPHPDSAKYPHHRLVYVEPIEDKQNPDATKSRWYYAAEREHQDDYNFEITYPYAGLTTCPRINRTYLVRRDEYAPLAKNTADPRSTAATADALFYGATLAYEEQKRVADVTSAAGSLFDALFVVVTRIFEKVPSIADQATYNAEISYPFQGRTENPRITRKFVVAKSAYAEVAKNTADTVYTGAKLAQQNRERFNDELADARYVLDVRVYDTFLTSPLIEKEITHHQGNIPEKFRIRTTKQTSDLIQTSVGATLSNPAGGDPRAVLREFVATMNLDGAERAAILKRGISMLLEVGPISGVELDTQTGQLLPFTQEAVPAGTAGSAVNSSGEYSTVEPHDYYWSIKTTRKTTSKTTPRVHATHEHHVWPPVYIPEKTVIFNEDGKFYTNFFFKPGYAGRCNVEYTETWSSTAPTIAEPTDPLITTGFQFQTPHCTFDFPECLHPLVEYDILIVLTTLVYTYPLKIPATPCTTWPTYITENEVIESDGGYLLRSKKIYSPTWVYSTTGYPVTPTEVT